jgi:DNA-directed RNA polymerase beta' subunit
MYNNEIKAVIDRISDANIIKMGKSLDSSPKKLILDWIKSSTTLIRPEIRKIGGNRSTMADITAMLRTIYELNSQIPKEIPTAVDIDLHGKLVMVDVTFFEMIHGSSGAPGVLSIVTNTNKGSNSFASRLPTKHGRIRGNLMGKRTTKMARSVITGSKALRPDQLGVPRVIAKNLYKPVTVHNWNRAELMKYFLNGPKRYPGCSKIIRKETGFEHYVENMPKDYILKDGDIVYRNIIDNDVCDFNREPALMFCSIATFFIKVIDGLTFQFNSVVCALFNKSVLKIVGCLVRFDITY